MMRRGGKTARGRRRVLGGAREGLAPEEAKSEIKWWNGDGVGILKQRTYNGERGREQRRAVRS